MKTVPQRDRNWLAHATPAAIEAARANGELAEILGGSAPLSVAATAEAGEQLTTADLDRMSPAQIVEARRAGLLDDLLTGRKA